MLGAELKAPGDHAAHRVFLVARPFYASQTLGLGLRFLARMILVRVDVGVSPEGRAVQMMVEQPFQF